MKRIYKRIEVASSEILLTLALFSDVGGTESVGAAELDMLKAQLSRPNYSGAEQLPIANVQRSHLEITNEGEVLAVLHRLKRGENRFVCKARYGTNISVQIIIDFVVTAPNETTPVEISENVVLVDSIGDGGGNAQSVTHAELVEMRDNAQLIAGTWYRITDFVTTVANKDNARSAGHAFDVLVRALDSSTLDENARAIQHAGDTYFADCNLAAWELKYSIDNNTDRFSWADDTNGKGVIWFMRDEWNNSAFYDFKNVQFKRWAVSEIQDANGNTLDDPTSTFAYNEGTQDIRYGYQGANYTNGKYTFVIEDADDFDWYYAFTWVNEDNEVEDATIVGQTLVADEGFPYVVHDNERRVCFVRNSEISEELMRDLDNGVVVATYTFEDGTFYGMYDTKTGNDCYSWTCGNSCYSWTCGNGCNSWTCGNDCYSWTCGNDCYSWTCGNSCYSWTCGNDCYSWMCGNGCNSWMCGNGCNSWTCGNGCNSWTCGNYCYSWTCGNDCYSWTCGNDCNSWMCGNYCYYWTCGNYCYSWMCGNYYRYFALEVGVQNVDISCTATTSSSAYAQNILIHSGVRGTGGSRVTCEIATTNNDFLTEFGTVVQGTIS